MTAHVVDANVINAFQTERKSENSSFATSAIEKCFSQGFIALDADGHCQQEWMDCAEGAWPTALSDWIADMFQKELLQLVRVSCDNMFKELSALGIPKKDHKWVRLARCSGSRYLITDDIDLIDPAKKLSATAQKLSAIKISGRGPVCKHLKKRYQIVVACPEAFMKT